MPDSPNPKKFWSVPVLVFLVAVLAKSLALNSWWCLDDWGQLARAAGLATTETPIPVRWFSQQFYWMATWPLFGLSATPYAISRILIHGFSAALVSRISEKAGLESMPSLVAGLVFASSPISFTALYWASGIQELLAGAFTLLAIDRWMAGNRKDTLLAAIFGIFSILSKESGLGLPLFLMATLIWKRRNGISKPNSAWILVIVLALTGIFEGILVWRIFPTGLNDQYSTGGLLVVLGNAGKFGWWLMTQGPVFTGQVTWTLAGIGLGFLSLWATWAFIAFRKGYNLPMALFFAAVLSLSPALVLVHQVRPYMGYLGMACLAISIGCLWPTRWKPGTPLKVALVSAAVIWGYWGMSYRVGILSEDGLPADPIVRAMERSRSWSHILQNKFSEPGFERFQDIFVLQQPLRAGDIARAQSNGDRFVIATQPFKILGGPNGLSLIAGKGRTAHWVNSLMATPSGAFVFCETNRGLKAWGPTRDALLYATLLDVYVGNFQRAHDQLRVASSIDTRLDQYFYDPEMLSLPMSAFREQSGRFIEGFLVTGTPNLNEGNVVAKEYGLFLDLLNQVQDAE